MKKFPRTPHFEWSPGFSGDDIRLVNLDNWSGRKVVVTEKLDGENTTAYQHGYIHSRSLDGANYPWQSYVKGMLSERLSSLPEGWKIYGENMFAIHSIEYSKLDSYFYLFGAEDEKENIVSYDDLLMISKLLEIPLVPIITVFDWDDSKSAKQKLSEIDLTKSALGDIIEGYVVRNYDSFNRENYADNVAKYVRKNHVQTDIHWTKTWKKAELYR